MGIFFDVPADACYAKAVAWTVKNGAYLSFFEQQLQHNPLHLLSCAINDPWGLRYLHPPSQYLFENSFSDFPSLAPFFPYYSGRTSPLARFFDKLRRFPTTWIRPWETFYLFWTKNSGIWDALKWWAGHRPFRATACLLSDHVEMLSHNYLSKSL